MTRRFLALHLPCLATDRLRRVQSGLPAMPLACWEMRGSRRLLSAVDPAATAQGLHPGQALADAQAMLPGLVLHPAEPAADAALLHALALWARRYTPLSATNPPAGLLLDITGCAHLLGGEAVLLRDALGRLGRAGLAARGAIAGAAATAAALARARLDDPVVVSGIEAAIVAPLPLGAALDLAPGVLESLERLGLRRVGDLLARPRGPLARRFGQGLLDALDALTGLRPSVLQPVAPPADFSVAEEPLEPVLTRGGIELLLEALLARLCAQLRLAGLGARQLTLLAFRVDGQVQALAVGTGQPSRQPLHLRRLFAEKLGRLEPELGFERLALEAHSTQPMAVTAQGALGIGGQRDASARAEALAQLLDRLGQRVRVRRVRPQASHWPERAVASLDPHAAVPPPPPGWAARPAPVLLLRRPEAVEAMAALPDDPPARLRWRGALHPVRRAEGPLRLEPEWWRSAQARRDYWQVELASGARVWLCRSGERWLVHGHLP